MTGASKDDCWISVDWGTSRFRVALVAARTGKVLAEHQSDQGVASFSRIKAERRADAFSRCLTNALRVVLSPKVRPSTVLVSGMASSSMGWVEIPYAPMPFSLEGTGAIMRNIEALEIAGHGVPVRLISGVCSRRDVMRGEESQLVGLAALGLLPESGDCTVILPGTHSKHARIQFGVMTDFQTYMTGELFDLLQQSATLAPGPSGVFSKRDFLSGVEEGKSVSLSSALFRVRSRRLLEPRGDRGVSDFLSGILVGSELASLCGRAVSEEVLVVGSAAMTKLYETALKHLHLAYRSIRTPATTLLAAGQWRIFSRLEEEKSRTV